MTSDVVLDFHDGVCLVDPQEFDQPGVMRMSKELTMFRERAGLSQQRLADMVGTSQSQIQRLEYGTRKLTAEWAERLAGPLKCAPSDLVPGLAKKMFRDESVAAPVTLVATVPIRGIAAAGQWIMHDEIMPDTSIPAIPHRLGVEQFAFKISGTSMDRAHIHDGSYVICVPYWMVRDAPTADDIVVVERRRGGLVERTCKQIVLTASHYELWPRSTNPQWQEPIRIPRHGEMVEDDGTEIEIVGRVIGIFTPV